METTPPIPREILVAMRAALGWRQVEAADYAGVSPESLKRAEKDPARHSRPAAKLVEAYRTAGVTAEIADAEIVIRIDRRAAALATSLVKRGVAIF